MKDKLSERIMKVFVALRLKMCSYLPDDGYVDKEAMGTKKSAAKQEIQFEDYKNCLENNKIILKSQQRFRSEAHNVFSKTAIKVALSNNNVQR